MGTPLTYKPWSSKHNTGGICNLSARHVDAIDVAWIARLNTSREHGGGQTEAQLTKGYFVNVSQGVQRTHFFLGSAATLCKTTLLYSFEGAFVLSGGDHLACLGFPLSVAYGQQLADSEKRNLAGEAFALPCAATVLYASALNPHAPWWG
jgi:hypothetical protein